MGEIFKKIKKIVTNKNLIVSFLVVLIFLSIFSHVNALAESVAKAVAGSVVNIAIDSLSLILSFFAKTLLFICSLFLTISGFILEKIMEITIYGFSDVINNSTMVSFGWGVFRDLANMAFLFLILWVGISTILGVGSGNPTSNIVKIILAAILINFSMFFAKLIIDIANVIAIYFYDLTLPLNSDGARSSIAGVLMEGFDLQTVYGDMNFSEGSSDLVHTKILLASVLGIIMMLITTWIFLTAAIMLLIRAIYLIVLVILSPFAFIAWIVPNMKSYTSKWWSLLFKHAFFAPIFMVMLYIIGFSIQNGGLFGGRNNDPTLGINYVVKQITDAPQNVAQIPGIFNIFFNFFILIGMMVASLMVASSLGTKTSSSFISWGKKLGLGAIGGIAGGATASILGGSAKRLEDKYGDKLRKGGQVGRLALRGTQALQDKKFFGKNNRSYTELKEKGTLYTTGTKERLADIKEYQNDPVKMADYFSSLNEKTQKSLYTDELSAVNRAAVELQAEKSNNTKLLNSIREHKKGLSVEDKIKLDEEIKKMKDKERGRMAITGLKDGAQIFGKLANVFVNRGVPNAMPYGGGAPIPTNFKKINELLSEKERQEILDQLSDPEQQNRTQKLFEEKAEDFFKQMERNVSGLEPKIVGKLTEEVNKNPELIRMLDHRQLLALNSPNADSELSGETIKKINDIINDPNITYKHQRNHQDKILKNASVNTPWLV